MFRDMSKESLGRARPSLGVSEAIITEPASEWTDRYIAEHRRRRIAFGIALGSFLLAGVFVGVYLAGFNPFQLRGIEREGTLPSGEIPTANVAMDIALGHARAWKQDASLALMNSGPVTQSGGSAIWKMIFVSSDPGMQGRGYLVELADARILSAAEIPFVGTGAAFPEGAKSHAEIIEQVRAINGYEDADILGIEAIYGAAGKRWYWGVRTSKGVVSITAER